MKVETRIKVQEKGRQLLSAALLKGLKALECPALVSRACSQGILPQSVLGQSTLAAVATFLLTLKGDGSW